MARRKSRTLTELELEIMQVVWAQEEAFVEDILAAFEKAGKPLAPPSVRTMLSILQRKGYVQRRRVGRSYAYKGMVAPEQAERHMLKDLIDRAFDGSAANLVAALVSQGMVQKDDLAKARRLIERHEKGDKP